MTDTEARTKDNQLTARDADSAYTMSYDALDRVTVVQDVWGKTLTFGYDARGNRTTVQDSEGGLATSTFDAKDQLTRKEHTGQATLRVDLGYLTDGSLESVTRYSDLAGTNKVAATTYTLDDEGRTTNVLSKTGGGTNISNLTYAYDAGDRITVETLNGTPRTNTYDDTDQLTADSVNTFTYDGTGNRNNGAWTSAAGNRLTNDGTWTYTWDHDGNLHKRTKGGAQETWSYGFDDNNQLIWVEKRDADGMGGNLLLRADIKYDAWGNRIEQALDTDGNGSVNFTRRYSLDGWDPAKAGAIGEENFEVWADLDGSSSLTTRYLRGDVVDQVFGRIDATTPYWTLTDVRGSVRDVLDNTGAVKSHLDYDGFGNVTTETGSAFSGRYGWTGRERDKELELQLNHRRYYGSTIARFISEDPWGLRAGDSNLYRYVHNNYPNRTDPSGLQPPMPGYGLRPGGPGSGVFGPGGPSGFGGYGGVGAPPSHMLGGPPSTARPSAAPPPLVVSPGMPPGPAASKVPLGGYPLPLPPQAPPKGEPSPALGPLMPVAGTPSWGQSEPPFSQPGAWLKWRQAKGLAEYRAANLLYEATYGPKKSAAPPPLELGWTPETLRRAEADAAFTVMFFDTLASIAFPVYGIGSSSVKAIGAFAEGDVRGGLRHTVEVGALWWLRRLRGAPDELSGWSQLSRDARRYLIDIEAQTGLRVSAAQRRLLADALRGQQFTRLTTTEAALHRAAFDRTRADLIRQWEQHTTQVWPRYTEKVVSKNGTVIRKVGDPYDAHHIIESVYGGPNQWWNIHPARFPNQHQGGIHRAGGVARQLFE